jgi:transcriptional regulator with XRE-family HTH domain
MTITDEAVSILSPNEMRETRRLYGLNLATISRYTDNSTTQLSQYENARNGLRADQLQRCREILLGAAVERAEAIQTFIRREQQKSAQTAALRYANSEPISSTDRISPQSGFSSDFQS